MVINWTKRYIEFRDHSNPFLINKGNDDELSEYMTGLISFTCKEQDLSMLDESKLEFIDGIIEGCKFPLSFSILVKNYVFILISYSPISLRTYELLSYRRESWGEYKTIQECMNKAIDILNEFKENILTNKENSIII